MLLHHMYYEDAAGKKSRRAQSQYIIDAQSYKEAAVVLFC